MNAVCVYVSAAQLVLQSDDNVDASAMQRRLLDIGRLLPHLRQLLSCVVCCRLLTDPFTPRTGRCQHNVCRQCVRERKSLRPLCPTCKDCQDFKMYEENRQMRCLLVCYKSLCEHLMSSTLFSQISKQRPPHPVTVNSTQPSIPLPHLSTQEFVLEGASYDDMPSSYSGDLPRGILPRPIVSIAAVTPTSAPNSIAHLPPNTQIAPKAATPPTNSSGSSSGVSTSLIIPTVPKRDNIINTSTVATTTTITSTPTQLAHSSSNSNSNINISSSNNSTSIAVQTQAHSTHSTTTTVATALPTVLPSHQQQQQQQHQQQQLHQQQQQQTLTMKHLRSIADLSAAALHVPTTATAKTLVPGSGTTITYVSGNTPGIVVPIVSSSGTTTAPLTIASAKFRQLAQARQQALNNSAAVTATASVTNATNITVATAKPLLSDLHQQHQPQQQLTRAPFKFSVTPAGVAVSTATSTSLQTVAGNAIAPTITTTTATTATVTSQIRHPPPIKTVSNGSAMYSVLYTGIGNKITIKRKTDGDDDATQKKNAATAAAASSAATSATTLSASGTSAAGTSPTNVFRQLPKPNPKRRGCRCGNATATPGKLTCCGQRCPCYVESKSCIGCKCRGCRNPHRPDGGKVRPVIPELACYEIQMADESSSLSPNELPIATACTMPSDIMQLPTTTTQHTTTTTTLEEYHNTATAATILPQHQFNNSTASATTTTTATLIPLRSLHQLTAAAQQQQHHHQQQQQQQHLHHQQQTQMFTSVASNSSGNSGAATTSTSNVLLQNAEGKYQVVPLHHFTTAHGHANQTVVGQIAGLQRSQTMTTVNSTFILPNAATVAAVTSTAASSSTCPTSSTANVISTQLPQIITMHQHQQTHLQQRITSSNTTAGTNVNTALPLQQLQQQLKQNNIITVHPLPPNTNSSSTNNNTINSSNSIHTQLQQLQQQHQQQQQQQHHHHHHQSIPLIGNSVSVAPNTTITLSPIIVNSTHAGNTFTADMFHTADGTSVGEYISVKSVRTATPNSNASSNSSSLSPQIITVPLAQASPLNTNAANLTCANVVSSSNNTGANSNNSANVLSNISVSVNNVTMHN